VETPGLEELNWEVWHKEGERWDFVTAQEHLEDLPLFDEQSAFLRIAQEKAQAQINNIYKENIGRTIAVISHGNVIRSFLTGIMGASVIGFLSLDIALTGISLIEINEKGRYKILFINNSDHLN
jgi:broad specificity phosphatase PhoE